MVANTQLFEVPLRGPAVAGLVNAIQSTGAEVVKVAVLGLLLGHIVHWRVAGSTERYNFSLHKSLQWLI